MKGGSNITKAQFFQDLKNDLLFLFMSIKIKNIYGFP